MMLSVGRHSRRIYKRAGEPGLCWRTWPNCWHSGSPRSLNPPNSTNPFLQIKNLPWTWIENQRGGAAGGLDSGTRLCKSRVHYLQDGQALLFTASAITLTETNPQLVWQLLSAPVFVTKFLHSREKHAHKCLTGCQSNWGAFMCLSQLSRVPLGIKIGTISLHKSLRRSQGSRSFGYSRLWMPGFGCGNSKLKRCGYSSLSFFFFQAAFLGCRGFLQWIFNL